MAEVNANSLPAKTDLGTNDSAIVVDQTTNAGALVDLDVLADKVLDRITSKTFANQVGGSSAATLLAQLSTLNSNLKIQKFDSISITNPTTGGEWFDSGIIIKRNNNENGAFIVAFQQWAGARPEGIAMSSSSSFNLTYAQTASSRPVDGNYSYWLAVPLFDVSSQHLWLKTNGSGSTGVRMVVVGDATVTLPS